MANIGRYNSVSGYLAKVLEAEMYKSEISKMDIERGNPMMGLASQLCRARLVYFLAKLDNRFRKFT